MKHYISLGAGVQSSTMALMAAAGEITPMPDGAIFADTQAEPKPVYEWLDWLEAQLPFPVHRVSTGDLGKSALKPHLSKKGGIYFKTAIPFHMRNNDGSFGRINHRSCTRDYKIIPITKTLRRLNADAIKDWRRKTRALVREMTALVRAGGDTATAKALDPVVCSWIGISLDEIQRAKPARDPWIKTRWPLIEQRMTRAACLRWMQDHGYPEPPRSACWFCPFRSNAEWRWLKAHSLEDFAAAVEFDGEARKIRVEQSENMRSVPYLHRSCSPLSEVDLRNDVDKGQLLLWQDECTGMCGV